MSRACSESGDEKGILVAHPILRERIGDHIQDREAETDVTGYYFADVLNGALATGRCLTYVFLKPEIGQHQTKHARAIRGGGLLFGSGWYEQ